MIHDIIQKITNRPFVIWGARITGLGFAKKVASYGMKALAFLDSDIALQGKQIDGITVLHPERLKSIQARYPKLIIVIAVALKEYEIIQTILSYGFTKNDYIIYSKYIKSFVTIDITGKCNLTCPSCPHGSKKFKKSSGYMPLETFKKVVDKALRETFSSHVSLYSWGEPLLHPDLPKMVRYLHKQNVAVAISTNLSIQNSSIIQKLMLAEPDYLKISVSGYYPKIYEDTHRGGNIDIVKSNLYRIKYFIAVYNLSTIVDVNYHLYNNNCGVNLEKMRELCDELKFSLSTTYALVMPLERLLDYYSNKADDEIKMLNRKLLVTIDEGVMVSKVDNLCICPFKENQININWDLSVPVCCLVYDNRNDVIVAENYLKTSLEEIDKRKQSVNICNECMKLHLPEYNMAFNKHKWDMIASCKECHDYDK